MLGFWLGLGNLGPALSDSGGAWYSGNKQFLAPHRPCRPSPAPVLSHPLLSGVSSASVGCRRAPPTSPTTTIARRDFSRNLGHDPPDLAP